MLLSKVVVQRKINARAVLASIRNHGDEVAGQLNAVCGALREDGTPQPEYGLVMLDLAVLLEIRSAELEAADWAHLDEEANDRALRRVRDLATGRLHKILSEISSTLDGVYGPGTSEEKLGLGVGMRARPEQMLELGRKALANLEKPDFEMPPIELDGVLIDLEAFKAQIAGHLGELEPAVHALAGEKRNFEKTLAKKREALVEYDRVYLQCVRLLQAFYRLSGNDELADRIRPTLPQTGERSPGSEEGGTSGSEEGGTPGGTSEEGAGESAPSRGSAETTGVETSGSTPQGGRGEASPAS